jgi:hypothetical protein
MMALCSPSATWWVKLTETCSNPAAVHLSEDGGLVDRQVDDAVGAGATTDSQAARPLTSGCASY